MTQQVRVTDQREELPLALRLSLLPGAWRRFLLELGEKVDGLTSDEVDTVREQVRLVVALDGLDPRTVEVMRLVESLLVYAQAAHVIFASRRAG